MDFADDKIFSKAVLSEYKDSSPKFDDLYFREGTEIPELWMFDSMRKSCGVGISKGYVESMASAIYTDPDEYQLAAVYKTKNITKDGMLGFVLLQKGECEIIPDAFAINLICSDSNMGKILMGLALYAIIVNPYIEDKTCVLELADGYMNPAGFCTYSKFGFKPDTKIYGEKCFEYTDNLPMKIDLNDADPEHIITVATTSTPTSETLCNVGAEKQPYFGLAMNLKIKLEIGEDLDEDSNYEKLSKNLKRKNIDSLLTLIQTKPVDKFAKYFDGIKVDSHINGHKSAAQNIQPPNRSQTRQKLAKAAANATRKRKAAPSVTPPKSNARQTSRSPSRRARIN